MEGEINLKIAQKYGFKALNTSGEGTIAIMLVLMKK